MLSLFGIPKGVRKRLEYYIDLVSFGKVMATKETIDSLSGTLFVGQKIKAG
jgi:hypothetical protein